MIESQIRNCVPGRHKSKVGFDKAELSESGDMIVGSQKSRLASEALPLLLILF